MSKDGIIVFVRKPEAGKVKTRLAKDIGNEAALSVYLRLLEHTKECVFACEADKLIWTDEPWIDPDFWPEEQFQFHSQKGIDLGEKMKNAFDFHFEQAYEKLLIIGSDCPELQSGILYSAFKLLDTFDAVLGPSLDGGYYLLGLKRPNPALFSEISWSTENVFIQTIERILSSGLQVIQINPLPDIDELNDLQYWPKHWEKLW
jgi:rSAM/selenodomain-associated transferase 1